MTAEADGVLPDDVIRDPHSNAELLYLTLADGADLATLEAFVRGLYAAIGELTAGEGDDRDASACVGWGNRLFARLTSKPADLPLNSIVGTPIEADLAIYILCRADYRLATFLRKLANLGAGLITHAESQRGFQRPDKRELGGFLDGLRNAQEARERTVFVDRDTAPEEPDPAAGGTYMVTMKITQDLEKWDQLPAQQQEAIMGRRKADGSRLDQPVGTPTAAEPVITAGGAEPLDSHVAKAGPRGESRDLVALFRRGFPFAEITDTGAIEAGLEFVSFQASLQQFTTIRDQWMGNTEFPQPGTNTDALFRNNFATVVNQGAFFVPAPVADYPGEGFFHPQPEDDRCLGFVTIRKTITNPDGTPSHAELGGFSFQLLDSAGNPAGAPFVTDSAGRATSPGVPRGVTYTLHETSPRPNITARPDQTIDLDHRTVLVPVVNTAVQPNPGYS